MSTAEKVQESKAPPLSKKEKGRLKKLRKRASELKEGCDMSGITDDHDWNEFKSFLRRTEDESSTVGPSIRLRKKNTQNTTDPNNNLQQRLKPEDWNKAEGNDHCHILCNLLFPQAAGNKANNNKNDNGKKRKRKAEISVSIPSWATLHNPVSMENVAILQIHIDSSTCSSSKNTTSNTAPWDDVLNLSSIRSLFMQNDNNPNNTVPLQTRWFQGPYPKSMSDTLLYLPKTSLQKSTSSKKQKTTPTCVSDVSSLLNDFVLTMEQQSKEGYPTLVGDRSGAMPLSKEDILNSLTEKNENLSASSWTQSDAKKIVDQMKVVTNFDTPNSGECTTQNDNQDPYVSTTFTQRQEKNTTVRCTPRIFGVDCEMVKTTAGVELGRVTLIQLKDFSEKDGVSYTLVLDELVKPHREILDYVTEYSGITAKQMSTVSLCREQIQTFLLAYLDEDDILIGHSLENDLKALRLVHKNVVDTSVLFRAVNNGGRKYSLRHLSAALLKKQIQRHDAGGHCSEEDAQATLDLAVRRAWFGSTFRIYERGDDRNQILQILNDETKQSCPKDGQMVCIGPSEWLQEHVLSYRHSAHALTCERIDDPNTKAVGAWLTSETRKAKIVWADLVTPPQVETNQSKNLESLNDLLSNLLARRKAGTMLLLAFQRGHRLAADLTQQRKACKNPKATFVWTEAQEETWKQALEMSRSGLAFWVGQ